MLDGAARLGPLFAEVDRLGMGAIAMTDHGNMFGAYASTRAPGRPGSSRSSVSRHIWRPATGPTSRRCGGVGRTSGPTISRVTAPTPT